MVFSVDVSSDNMLCYILPTMKAAFIFASLLWIMTANVADSSPSRNKRQGCFCTKEYEPVCGKVSGELRDFDNICEFRRAGGKDADIVFNESCKVYADFKKCEEKCPQYFQGVCASDGKTYAGDCYVECYRKFERGKGGLCVVRQGDCNQKH
uniref:Kazal-like domain-containing protein n=2 Tax=Lygus hesperus TaxID=30085 RepID=A0A0A9WFZ4_LYGHE